VERAADTEAARRLIPLDQFIDALRWTTEALDSLMSCRSSLTSQDPIPAHDRADRPTSVGTTTRLLVC